MGGIAQGGLRPILLWIAMGLAIEAVALTIHDLDGLGHVFAVICMIFATFLTNFYRDPDRRIPKESGVVVSPADGRIMFTVRERATGRRPTSQQMDESADRIESDEMTGDWWPTPCENPVDFTTEQRWEAVRAGEEADTDALRVAIFMSPFDVHVNRVPIASTIERIQLSKGAVTSGTAETPGAWQNVSITLASGEERSGGHNARTIYNS